MLNGKKIICYVVLMMIAGLSGGYFLDNNIFNYPMNAEWIIIVLTIIGKAMAFFFLMLIIWSWVNNIIFVLFWKARKYRIIGIHIYPFFYIKDDQRKIRFGLLSFVDIKSKISLEKIASIDDIEKYIEDRKTISKILKMVHVIILIVSFSVVGINIFLAIFLILSQVSMMIIYSLGTYSKTSGGIYEWANIDEKKIYLLFGDMPIEKFDKSEIYKYVQDKMSCTAEDLIENWEERTFLHNILLDSITEERNYLSEEREQELLNIFYYSSEDETICYDIRLEILFKLFYIYLMEFNTNENVRESKVKKQFRIAISYWERALYLLRKANIDGDFFDIKLHGDDRNRYETFSHKINLIYALLKKWYDEKTYFQ